MTTEAQLAREAAHKLGVDGVAVVADGLIKELRAEIERLTGERDRWQHDALGWSDRLTAATDEIERLQAALGELLDSLPPDFPNRAHYNEITARSGDEQARGK